MNYVLNVHGRWDAKEDDEACIEWAREFFRKSKPFASGGAYINFLTQDEADRTESAYGPTFKRLQAIKKKYDPDNLFRMNQNIKPDQFMAALKAKGGWPPGYWSKDIDIHLFATTVISDNAGSV